jgi:hypothetical protein
VAESALGGLVLEDRSDDEESLADDDADRHEPQPEAVP